MAYNFKKINDVPIVEAMKNDLNVFVEDGRKMAKIPANKMIPEDVALKSDIPEVIPVPATAEVGQVVAVKAVDENGKPTEWEAVDMSAGNSGGVRYHAQGGRIFRDLDCTDEVEWFCEEFGANAWNGRPSFIVDMDDEEEPLYTVVTAYQHGNSYSTIECGNKTFYDNGHSNEPM